MLKLTDGSTQKVEKLERIERPESKIHFVQKIIKGETYMVMAQSAIEIEDEFSSLYYTASNQSNLFLMPPFEPTALLNLVQTNNVLNQCIEAMEVNIDGTGHEFVAVNEDVDIDKKEQDLAEAFFNEPYPNLSFPAIRRKLRRSLESVGYGFLEVLRNMADEVVGLRNIETHNVRMVKLDAPVQVKKKVSRDGKDIELTLWERERRFAQRVALKQLVYYREFGTSRQVDRNTGAWETDAKVKLEDRGTELLMFGIHPDTSTPYYLPRWINQLPSVVGSRNAEEQNLQFLDAGGMPPAIVFIQGGTLIKDTSDQLKMYLSGMNKNKNRAVVVEVQSSSGSLDSQGRVDVKVERFGSSQAQDAMFMKYDVATEEHVRVGFRLPPLFLGKAADYNFATAQTGYMVAEAQVFLPERAEFDELINKTIIKELGLKTVKIKSKPITLKDVATQLKALELSKDVATRDSFMMEMNTISGMMMVMAEVPAPNISEGELPFQNTKTVDETNSGDLPASVGVAHMNVPQALPKKTPMEEESELLDVEKKRVEIDSAKRTLNGEDVPKKTPEEKEHGKLDLEKKRVDVATAKQKLAEAKKPKKAIELIELAHDYAALRGLVKKQELTPERALLVKEEVAQLEAEDMNAFNSLLATYTFGADDMDLVHIASHTH